MSSSRLLSQKTANNAVSQWCQQSRLVFLLFPVDFPFACAAEPHRQSASVAASSSRVCSATVKLRNLSRACFAHLDAEAPGVWHCRKAGLGYILGCEPLLSLYAGFFDAVVQHHCASLPPTQRRVRVDPKASPRSSARSRHGHHGTAPPTVTIAANILFTLNRAAPTRSA